MFGLGPAGSPIPGDVATAAAAAATAAPLPDDPLTQSLAIAVEELHVLANRQRQRVQKVASVAQRALQVRLENERTRREVESSATARGSCDRAAPTDGTAGSGIKAGKGLASRCLMATPERHSGRGLQAGCVPHRQHLRPLRGHSRLGRGVHRRDR